MVVQHTWFRELLRIDVSLGGDYKFVAEVSEGVCGVEGGCMFLCPRVFRVDGLGGADGERIGACRAG